MAAQEEAAALLQGESGFGQRVDLTTRIRQILVDYPEGTSILKELIQNAVRPVDSPDDVARDSSCRGVPCVRVALHVPRRTDRRPSVPSPAHAADQSAGGAGRGLVGWEGWEGSGGALCSRRCLTTTEHRYSCPHASPLSRSPAWAQQLSGVFQHPPTSSGDNTESEGEGECERAAVVRQWMAHSHARLTADMRERIS